METRLRACQNRLAMTAMELKDRRRVAPALNIYVNPFPEWSRAMVLGNSTHPRKPGARCPKCGSCDTRPSVTRTLSDFFLLFFDYTNLRCRQCTGRFRVWRPARSAQKVRSVSVL